jgi:CRP-like cAMP-binding protein
MAPVLPWVLDGILANVSQGTALATYFFIDPWNLQTVAVFSATTQVLFYFLQRPPVWIFVFWNVLQFCINTVQIVRLAVDTTEVQFDERELQALALTLHCFDSVPSRKIARVLRSGEWLQTKQGETVCVLEDGEGDHVHFVVEGAVEAVSRDGHVCYRADTGGFVGEASLAHAVSGTLPDYDSLDVPDAARCVALGDVRTLRWSVRRLARVLRRDAELLDAFREALALDFYARGRRPFVAASMASRRGLVQLVRHRRGESVAVTSQPTGQARKGGGRRAQERPEPAQAAVHPPHAARAREGLLLSQTTSGKEDADAAAVRFFSTHKTPRRRESGRGFCHGCPDLFVSSDDDVLIDRVASDEVRGRVAVGSRHLQTARRPITQKGVPIPRKDRAESEKHALLRCCWCFYIPSVR